MHQCSTNPGLCITTLGFGGLQTFLNESRTRQCEKCVYHLFEPTLEISITSNIKVYSRKSKIRLQIMHDQDKFIFNDS